MWTLFLFATVLERRIENYLASKLSILYRTNNYENEMFMKKFISLTKIK